MFSASRQGEQPVFPQMLALKSYYFFDLSVFMEQPSLVCWGIWATFCCFFACFDVFFCLSVLVWRLATQLMSPCGIPSLWTAESWTVVQGCSVQQVSKTSSYC